MILTIAELRRRALAFRPVLEEAKRRAAPADFAWYPYDSLANWEHLDQVLTGANREILELAGSAPLLDIGPADGATSFFLESLGREVCVVDKTETHHSGMQGFWKLHAALGSQIPAYHVDLDHDWTLPREDFGLALFLGVLYHLKNPFGAMERLAGHAKYCLLSTRVTQHAEPLAYLVGPGDACGADETNYWLFSESGLRRLCERAGWEILDWRVFPTEDPEDFRAFCLLRSTVLEDWLAVRGWYDREATGRWTARTFGAELPRPAGEAAGEAAELEMEFYVHPNSIAALGSLCLTASHAGEEFARVECREAGVHRLRGRVEGLTGARMTPIAFTLDKALPPAGLEARELGVYVTKLGWG
jgi:hypothetical protein